MLPKLGTVRRAARALRFPSRAFAFAFAVLATTSWTSCTTSVSALVAEPPRQGGSSCALRTAEQIARDKPFVTNPLPRPSHSCLLSSLLETLRGGVVWPDFGSLWMSGQRRRQQHQRKTSAPATGSMATSSTSKEDATFADIRDSFVPLFSGQPSDYREWRQRIQLYHRKMVLSKRSAESVINVVSSFKGVAPPLGQHGAPICPSSWMASMALCNCSGCRATRPCCAVDLSSSHLV